MSDSIGITCPKCGASCRIEAGTASGSGMACPKCGEGLDVPLLQEAATSLGTATLAGSPDDRLVTLPLAASESPTEHMPDDVAEALLRASDSASGRYVEQGVIAQGGMGEIVLCIDRDIRRPIALKRMLTATADDPSRRARFIEEAQVTGQLEHPNIVPVHELTRRDDGSVYFTMKLVKGKSLADILGELRAACPVPRAKEEEADAPLSGHAARGTRDISSPSLGDLLQIFLKVCDGVAFAHSRGVLHRDLKPANIMVGDFGEVLVMDWGLAKVKGREDVASTRVAPTNLFVGGPKEKATGTPANEFAGATPKGDRVSTSRIEKASTRTIEGSMIGTPAYMPPEQAEGKLDQIDERSDIYSLGAILYEMLALERAIQGETQMAVILNVVKGNIELPEQRAPGRTIPRELSAIAMKCLSKLRARRYRSVLDLKRDIGLFLEGRSVSASPDTFGQAVVKLVKRNKGVSAAIGAAAVVLIAVGIFSYARIVRERNIAVGERAAAQASERKAVAAQQQQRATALAASEEMATAALRAAEEGRMAEADFRASAAVKILPDGPWGHYALAMVARARNDLAAARRLMEKALAFDPAHGPSKAALAQILGKDAKPARVNDLLAQVKEAKDWRTLVAAGEALISAARYEDAVKAYERAVALMEKDPTRQRGALDEKRGRLVEAREMLIDARARVSCAGFYDSIRGLPVEEQKARIAAKFKEVHGADCDMAWWGVENGVITGMVLGNYPMRPVPISSLQPLKGMPLKLLRIAWSRVSDLSPLKGMPLESLTCDLPTIRDLGALKGMTLRHLDCGGSGVSDLRPLEGMPLRELVLNSCVNVTDLAPLKGMQLDRLDVSSTKVCDLRHLAGMPLKQLDISYTPVSDLSPLKGMALTQLGFMGNQVADLSPLEGMPLPDLNCSGLSVKDWSPLRKLPLLKGLCLSNVHVSLKDTRFLEGMRLTYLSLYGTDASDLTVLRGMPLETLHIGSSLVADLSPLKGLPLVNLACEDTPASDLSPLDGLKLRTLAFTPKSIKKGIEAVRGMESLEKIGTAWSTINMTPAEFWKKYDAGEFK